jgi:hypothetical protein
MLDNEIEEEKKPSFKLHDKSPMKFQQQKMKKGLGIFTIVID